MDPKKLQNLDPKLQEAYKRVMTTPIPTQPQQPVNKSAPLETSPASDPPPTKAQSAVTSYQLPTLTPVGPPKLQTQKITIGSSEHGTVVKKKSGASPVILFVAAVIFFLVYALFWINIFNVSLPFLP